MATDVVKFGGRVTWPEFRHVQLRLRAKWNRWVVLGPPLLLFLLWLGGDIETWRARPIEFAIDLAWYGLVLAGLIAMSRGAQYYQWKKQLESHGEVTGNLGEAGPHWKTELLNSDIAWSNLIGHKIDDQLVLLYYTHRCAYFLPRSFFADEASWNALQTLVKQRAKAIG